MAGGNGSPIARVMGQINQSEQIGRSNVPSFVAPSQLGQQTVYQPGYAPQQMSPLVQQMMMQRQMQQPIMGLPAALMQMQGRLNQPMMRGPMPVYENPALSYRPDMAAAQAALSRVKPSVYKSDLDAARARIAELEATQQRSVNDPYYGSYSNPGG